MRRKVRDRLRSLTLIDIAAGAAVSVIPLTAANAQPSPAFNWSGFYTGAHVGYRWADATFQSNAYTYQPGFGTFNYPARNDQFSFDGGIGGAHFGYNWLINQNWLFGFEGDWSWGRSKEISTASYTNPAAIADGFTFRRSELTLQWQATMRARAGWVVQSSLWYVTGGVAFARTKWSEIKTLIGDDAGEERFTSVSAHKTLTGFVVGGGFEQALSPNWTWRVEYLYESFGDHNVPHGFGPQVGTLDLEHIQKVRIGFTYKP